MKIVNVEQMRRIEQVADAGGHSYAAMMDMAGRSVAETADNLILGDVDQNVLVLVGPGNNGGDGLVAARYLLDAGHNVTVYVWKRAVKGDENFTRLKRRRRGVAILWADNDAGYQKLREEVRQADLVLDALLGTGVVRPIDGKLAEMLAVVKEELARARNGVSEEGPAEELSVLPRFPIAEAQAWGAKVEQRPSSADDEDDEWDDEWDEDFEAAQRSLAQGLMTGSESASAEGGPADGAGADEGAAVGLGPDEDDDDDDEDFLDDFEDEEDLAGTPPWPSPTVLAVDCPSGLNCDTGALDPAALAADMTVTFAYPKWGQLEYPGAGACGLLAVAPIGVRPELAADVHAELVDPETVRLLLPRRPQDANKGTFGKAMVVGGSLNYTGAVYLSASAASRSGAGLITLAAPAPLHAALAGVLPNITWLLSPGSAGRPAGIHTAEAVQPLLAGLKGYDALLVGPGLTTRPEAVSFIEGLFGPDGLSAQDWRGRVIVDADALNILSGQPDWPAHLPPGSILTPHPGEMGRLTGLSPAEINAERIATALRWAARWGHIVLLKGAYTVIAHPDGRAAVLPFANPVLATAGSGDVLAGAILGMLAQGLPAFEAALCGGYLHGHTGLLLLRGGTPAGAVAQDLLARFPEALAQLYGLTAAPAH
jgi:hydroxyethylthiazole kinase-like uncharacterized protein yjeF